MKAGALMHKLCSGHYFPKGPVDLIELCLQIRQLIAERRHFLGH